MKVLTSDFCLVQFYTEELVITTYMFPGQGSQHPGMGEELFTAFPDITEEADEILGYSIQQLCHEDRYDQLGQTQYTQPAIYTVSVLSYLDVCRKNDRKPDYVVGHSVGEYAALYVGGVFNFVTGLKLVQRRAELMAEAGNGAMAAVLGLNLNQVEEIILENNISNIEIANDNTLTQVVVSGTQNGINDAQQIFLNAGAELYIPLNVSGAFHSSYMGKVKNSFLEFLDQFTFSNFDIPVIANVSAEPYKKYDIKEFLSHQITHRVKWTGSIKYLLGQGETKFKEISPENTLTRMVEKIRNGQ